MPVLTLYFAGSGHGLGSEKDNEDTLVDAFNHTRGPKALFPGPGGADPNIYVSGDFSGLYGRSLGYEPTDGRNLIVGQNFKKKSWRWSSAQKRGGTGKGWNMSAHYALRIIANYLKSGQRLTLNLCGHSRGSITIIMLLNDMFYQHLSPDSFTMAGTVKGVKTFTQKEAPDWNTMDEGQEFNDWYEKRLKTIWKSRLNKDAANAGLEALHVIKKRQGQIAEVNAWMFDPVAGLNQGNTSRKQDFPDHPLIKRVRVLRMEHGGIAGGLSTNMPTFPGWAFLDGRKTRNLSAYMNSERLVIPLPGSHGSGLSANKGASLREQFIGTSLMTGFLTACGTDLGDFAAKWGDPTRMRLIYDQLLAMNLGNLPGSGEMNSARAKIHAHHTRAGYAGNAINADHAFLNWQEQVRAEDANEPTAAHDQP